MTRFDEALNQFSRDSERDMAARVGSVGNRYATVQEVGRGRTRRLALQSVASVGVVAMLAGVTWYAAGQLRDVDPAGPAVSEITWLGDPTMPEDSRFVCGVPLPVDVEREVTTASGDQTVPTLTQKVTVTDGAGTRDVDVSPGATTLLTEDGVAVESEATWEGDEPQFWGLSDYGVLVDADGNVVARTANVQSWDATTGAVSAFQNRFVTNSCTVYSEGGGISGPEYLDGTYSLHIVTQLWVDNRRNPVVQWVDAGLPDGAELTFDWEAYQAEQRRQEEAADQQFQELKAAVAASGTSLADLTGTGVTARMGACEVAESLGDGGLGSVAAMSAALPTAPVEITDTGFAWTFTRDEDPGWDGVYDYVLVYTDAAGNYVATATARPHTTSEGPQTTSRAKFGEDIFGMCDAVTGPPTAPGTYNVYLMVTGPALDEELAPESTRDLGGWGSLSTWIPVGTYTVP